ncbi:putative COPII coat assembly protein SEC16 [Glarea lozoyensis 74030]|uniref:Putative COPII coat assembly protein SEC16 n=1 Tax=Glarea lozoyensis (strain ATCC 74030 / MF5533) TaxID=1104152 RepID=H0ECC1_GLAL7|nr:putative COPII coat assembly protein SEC16 [Glarea lozoyensis 74030]
MPKRIQIPEADYSILSEIPLSAMASESATSSWHPAMMPNSLTDRTEEPSQDSSHFGALPEQIQATEASNPDSNTSTPPADTDPPRRNEVPVQDPSIAGIKDNGDDAELNSLRNALTTSLSSPGGVELQESPVHKSVDPADHFDDEIDFPLAEFPSEGPKHENKHLSTMSFARTVSDDVSWGEDDDVDPEWNSSKDDTNPFKMLAKSDRTNSFPAVPPLHNPAQDNGEETMVQSQAESIMNAIEQEPREMFGDDTIDENASFSHQAANPNSTSEASTPLESGQAEESLPAYGRSYGGDYEQAQDQDTARYEEGVPLFQHEEVQNNGQGSSAFLGDVETGEGDDFFAQVSRSKDTEQQETSPPAVLERKSTMQVMDSLHLQPQDDILDTPIEPKDEQQTSFHRATGGGIAASASTIISQVIGELDVPVHENSKEGVPLELDAVEADLAEKWKAALAGDEFLDDEDDELLPDDEPVESGRPLDPSALFGSDDEGFLDDPDEPAGSGTGTGSGDFFARASSKKFEHESTSNATTSRNLNCSVSANK